MEAAPPQSDVILARPPQRAVTPAHPMDVPPSRLARFNQGVQKSATRVNGLCDVIGMPLFGSDLCQTPLVFTLVHSVLPDPVLRMVAMVGGAGLLAWAGSRIQAGERWLGRQTLRAFHHIGERSGLTARFGPSASESKLFKFVSKTAWPTVRRVSWPVAAVYRSALNLWSIGLLAGSVGPAFGLHLGTSMWRTAMIGGAVGLAASTAAIGLCGLKAALTHPVLARTD